LQSSQEEVEGEEGGVYEERMDEILVFICQLFGVRGIGRQILR